MLEEILRMKPTNRIIYSIWKNLQKIMQVERVSRKSPRVSAESGEDSLDDEIDLYEWADRLMVRMGNNLEHSPLTPPSPTEDDNQEPPFTMVCYHPPLGP